jgi:hypothetical protein
MIQERTVFRIIGFTRSLLWILDFPFYGIGFSGLFVGFSQDLWIWSFLDIGVLVNQSI